MLTIERPADLHEAQERRSLLGARGAFVGGGTALQLAWRDGTPALTLVDVSGLPGALGLSLAGAHLRIGAATRLETLRRDPLVQRHAPLLVDACEGLAALSIRHLATLGGNVGWGHGDTLAVLLALEAEAELADGGCLALADVIEAPELPLLAALRVDTVRPPALAFYEKIGHRAAFSPTRLALAFCAGIDGAGRLNAPRVAASGAGLRARRLRQVERMLNDAPLHAIGALALREACAHDLDQDAALARVAAAVLAGRLEASAP